MKKIISSLSFIAILFQSISFTAWAESASKLELTLNSETISVWQSVELTVKATDSNWWVAKTYKWTIFMFVEEDANSSDDLKATIPYWDSGYSFKSSDNWSKTFSWKDAITFKREWEFTIIATDLDNESISWKIKITVGKWSSKTNSTSSWSQSNTSSWSSKTWNSDLEITSPEEWTKIFEWKTSVAWVARKNSKVKAFVNLKEVWEAQTDKDGNFNFDINWLTQTNNKIEVKLYDWNDKMITSKTVSVQVDAEWPTFNWLTVKEWDTVAPWATLNIEVSAEAWLKDVKVMLGEETQGLAESENEEWKYTWTIAAPSEVWEYPIKVVLKDEQNKETVKDNAKTIVVERKESLLKNIQVAAATNPNDKKINFKFELNWEAKDVVKFKIKYGSWADNLDKEVLTYEKEKIEVKSDTWATATESWSWEITITNKSYAWYIPGLDPNGKYFFLLVFH